LFAIPDYLPIEVYDRELAHAATFTSATSRSLPKGASEDFFFTIFSSRSPTVQQFSELSFALLYCLVKPF
jgi:hypothetical protein